jgi:potassium-dependent mechanosensitive channel
MNFGIRVVPAAALAAILLAVTSFVCLAIAEESSPTGSGVAGATSGGEATELVKKRQAVSARISELTAAASGEKEKEEEADATGAKRDETLNLLRSLDGVYAQHLTVLQHRQQLADQVQQVNKELESLGKFGLYEPKPYSFILLDNLKDQLAVEEDNESATNADLKSAKQLLQSAHAKLDDVQKNPRPVAAAGSAHDELAPPALALLMARATVALRQAEVEVQSLRLDLSKARQKQLDKKIEIVAKDVKFSVEDRDKQVAQLLQKEADSKQRRKDAESHFQQLESDKKAALDELGAQKATPQAVDAAGEAWRVAGAVYQAEAAVLDQQIDSLANVRRNWTRRYELAAGSVPERRAAQWLEDLDEFLDQLKDTSQSLEHRRDTIRNEQAAAKRATVPEGATKWVEMAAARRQELRDLCEASLEDVKSQRRMLDRFRTALKAKVTATTADGVAGWVGRLFGSKIEVGEEESITVGKLLLLMAYVVIGMLAAYSASRLFNRRLLSRLGLHQGTIAALRSITFYSLCIVFAVMAFQLLHIPLAAFAFLGGAAAIAVGFGSQDIMNNFMSGIILLTEQPIRVGDVVQLSGVQGKVLHIGLRSTRLQTDSNHELIVPNKTLIDEQVTNLTLSDNFVQTFVPVVTERDIDVQKAKWDMMHIAFSHPLVMKSPRPLVLLTEIETYWLTFEVHFWLEHGSFIRCALAQSEIMEQISDLFKPPPESEQSAGADAPAVDAPAGDATRPADSSAKPVSLGDVQKMSRAAMAKQAKRLGLKL